jgi:hypothetical protein
MGNTASSILDTGSITQEDLSSLKVEIDELKTSINTSIDLNTGKIENNEEGDSTFRNNFANSTDFINN